MLTGSQAIEPLAPGQTVKTWTRVTTTPGDYHLIVQTDAGQTTGTRVSSNVAVVLIKVMATTRSVERPQAR